MNSPASQQLADDEVFELLKKANEQYERYLTQTLATCALVAADDDSADGRWQEPSLSLVFPS